MSYVIGFAIEPALYEALDELATVDGKPVEDLAAELLWAAIAKRRGDHLQTWDRLTPREREIASLICSGYTNREMADELWISLNTVKTHVRHVLRKYQVNSKDRLRRRIAIRR